MTYPNSIILLRNIKPQKLAQQSQISHGESMVHCTLQGGNLFHGTSCDQKVIHIQKNNYNFTMNQILLEIWIRLASRIVM